jgi:hypothetical protein
VFYALIVTHWKPLARIRTGVSKMLQFIFIVVLTNALVWAAILKIVKDTK